MLFDMHGSYLNLMSLKVFSLKRDQGRGTLHKSTINEQYLQQANLFFNSYIDIYVYIHAK